ncbi:MAG: rod shape-determining protein [Eubacteriales bacterium]|nr:rod shape-determining protein [Eubacteriales bacterium]
MAFSLYRLFGKDVGVDLGSVNTLFSLRGSGVILREPSCVALDHNEGIIAAGNAALDLIGRSPGTVRVVQPLQNGVIADYRLCEAMLRAFLEDAFGKTGRLAGVRAVICVPGSVTEIEKRALEEAARSAGAHTAYLMDEPVAAALGAGLNIEVGYGCMVADIGGGTTDAAVLSMGGVVQKQTAKAGGAHIDAAIMEYCKTRHRTCIGMQTAEHIKLDIASALPGRERCIEVRGRDLESGLPRTLILTGQEIHVAIQPQLFAILGCIKQVLANTPPELAGDLLSSGILLTGGTALLHGMAAFIGAETTLPVRVADHPLDCVAEGARIAVEHLQYYRTRAV